MRKPAGLATTGIRVRQVYDRKGNLLRQEVVGKVIVDFDPWQRVVEILFRDWMPEDEERKEAAF